MIDSMPTSTNWQRRKPRRLPKYVVSKAAQSDLRGIVRYTVDKWDAGQARRYLARLEAAFELLAQNPGLGRPCDFISDGLHRHEVDKHVIFYRETNTGVRIIRVLHMRMLPIKPRFGP